MASGEQLALESGAPAPPSKHAQSKESQCLPVANTTAQALPVAAPAAVESVVVSAIPQNEKDPVTTLQQDASNYGSNQKQAEKPLGNVLDRLEQSLQERNEKKKGKPDSQEKKTAHQTQG